MTGYGQRQGCKVKHIGAKMTKSITVNSNAHIMLMFARSLRKKFTIEDIRTMSPVRFSSNKHVRRSAERLSAFGYINPIGRDCWQITPAGLDALYVLGRPN